MIRIYTLNNKTRRESMDLFFDVNPKESCLHTINELCSFLSTQTDIPPHETHIICNNKLMCKHEQLNYDKECIYIAVFREFTKLGCNGCGRCEEQCCKCGFFHI